jgi:hypothetical protein
MTDQALPTNDHVPLRVLPLASLDAQAPIGRPNDEVLGVTLTPEDPGHDAPTGWTQISHHDPLARTGRTR